jgi:hypothetical protein
MNPLEIKRKELELMRVETARKELEFKVEERIDEINRVKEQINIQLAKEEEIRREIKKMRNE